MEWRRIQLLQRQEELKQQPLDEEDSKERSTIWNELLGIENELDGIIDEIGVVVNEDY
jgi:hypothetical protein